MQKLSVGLSLPKNLVGTSSGINIMIPPLSFHYHFSGKVPGGNQLKTGNTEDFYQILF